MTKSLAFLGILLVTHELLARALDRAELIERLLAPGPDALVALPFAALFYVVRFALIFVAPALVSLALGRVLIDRLARSGPSRPRAPRAPVRDLRGEHSC